MQRKTAEKSLLLAAAKAAQSSRSNMLPSSARLSRTEFTAFLAQKGVFGVYNNLGTLKFSFEHKGFAVVTSSKAQKRAVVRNKLRRRIYSLYKQNGCSFGGILYVSKQSYTMEYDQIAGYFDELLAKMHKAAK